MTTPPGITKCANPPRQTPMIISTDQNNPTILPWAVGCQYQTFSMWKERTMYGYNINVSGPQTFVITVFLTCGPIHAITTSSTGVEYKYFKFDNANMFLAYTRDDGTNTYIYNFMFINFSNFDLVSINSYDVSVSLELRKNISGETQVVVTSNLSNNNIVMNQSCCMTNTDEMQEVPRITITLQSDINSENMGEAAFNVYDATSYCTEYPCNKEDCHCQNIISDNMINVCPVVTIPSSKVKLTQYSQYPHLQKVIRGKGCTLREKATSIKDDPNITVNEFMLRLMTYGMLKYILSRLIFGNFDLKWLLQKNNKEFFIKLENSRLCRFIAAFEDPEIRGYNKYFK